MKNKYTKYIQLDYECLRMLYKDECFFLFLNNYHFNVFKIFF